MPARPTYDKDLLLRLKMQHPDWPDAKIAQALNEDNRRYWRDLQREEVRCRRPEWTDAEVEAEVDYREERYYEPTVVSASTVQSAVFRNKEKWKLAGFTIPRGSRKSDYVRGLMALRGFRTLTTEENHYSVPLRRLRQCERLAQGLRVPESEAIKAERWEIQMRAKRTVVDLDENGHAYVRAAERWELDPDGNLLGLTALAEPSAPPTANLTPDMNDAAERAIWEREGMSDEDKRRVIAELRMTSLTAALDEPSDDDRVPNGSKAG